MPRWWTRLSSAPAPVIRTKRGLVRSSATLRAVPVLSREPDGFRCGGFGADERTGGAAPKIRRAQRRWTASIEPGDNGGPGKAVQ
jgi:hypothetical protein